MPNWQNEYRRCDNCRSEYRPQKSASSRALNIPDFGALVREQIIVRQHLENPITLFLPDGSKGRVWLATDKHGSQT